MVAASPFEDLPAGSQQNPDRSFYVSDEVIRAVLERGPGVFWRLVIALSRYAGLRIPSEVATLTWEDIAWDTGRLTVRSPKTARHEGHAVRLVPICPELRVILTEAYEQAADGTNLVLPRALTGASNLRTTFKKFITRAGHTPWPRLFQNLRASCATDWVERYPNHVVAKWLGQPTERAQGEVQLTVVLDGKPYNMPMNRNEKILDIALSLGLDLPYSCKAGVCCTCRCKVMEGTTEMEKNFTLEKPEVEQGFILSCQARPTSERVVISFDER